MSQLCNFFLHAFIPLFLSSRCSEPKILVAEKMMTSRRIYVMRRTRRALFSLISLSTSVASSHRAMCGFNLQFSTCSLHHLLRFLAFVSQEEILLSRLRFNHSDSIGQSGRHVNTIENRSWMPHDTAHLSCSEQYVVSQSSSFVMLNANAFRSRT